MKIGFDLDRVLVNYPPIVPGKLIDWLYKNHNHTLSYRIPTSKIEILIRKLSHLSILRRPIALNVDLVKKLSAQGKNEYYLISSRYNFLEAITFDLLKRYGLISPFKKIYLNTGNEQAHLYKEKIIKQLGIKIFVDDDLELLNYLKQSCPGVKLIHYLPGDDLEKYFRYI